MKKNQRKWNIAMVANYFWTFYLEEESMAVCKKHA